MTESALNQTRRPPTFTITTRPTTGGDLWIAVLVVFAGWAVCGALTYGAYRALVWFGVLP